MIKALVRSGYVAAKRRHIGASLGKAEQCCFFRPDGVHDRTNVVHPLLERGQFALGHAVGHPGPALVEEDQT